MIARIALGLVIVAIGDVSTSCESRPAQTIVVGEEYAFGFNAESGDTVILVMNPDGGQLERCNDFGGELTFNAHSEIWTCESVDF